jgi:hypothetical protein
MLASLLRVISRLKAECARCKNENVVHNNVQCGTGGAMGEVTAMLSIGLAGLALLGTGMAWRKVVLVQRECAQRATSADNRLRSLSNQLRRLEQEVTRQGIELEDQGIQLETRSYWED